ncbi:unnamed protein product [Brachionus calyciflorus]|uniref:Uncharacterized protein n=1 Tax=Brachionus calyciflorus TaxID=104777 RepID=A0A814C7K9_9BILA|nr:unnamed protein product [Brachionus calyciflorus]
MKEPESLEDIVLPSELLKTFKDETLIYDSGVYDKDRCFVFGTEAGLKLLEGCDILADGTFDISPKLFVQVNSLRFDKLL